jgi:hypothetical protein
VGIRHVVQGLRVGKAARMACTKSLVGKQVTGGRRSGRLKIDVSGDGGRIDILVLRSDFGQEERSMLANGRAVSRRSSHMCAYGLGRGLDSRDG